MKYRAKRSTSANGKDKYHSKLERRIHISHPSLQRSNIKQFRWKPPTRTYTPDFVARLRRNANIYKILHYGLKPNLFDCPLVYIEAKGVLSLDDRNKMKAVKAQHPEANFLFLFQDATKTIGESGKSKTYGEWAAFYGFAWAEVDSTGRMPKDLADMLMSVEEECTD